MDRHSSPPFDVRLQPELADFVHATCLFLGLRLLDKVMV